MYWKTAASPAPPSFVLAASPAAACTHGATVCQSRGQEFSICSTVVHIVGKELFFDHGNLSPFAVRFITPKPSSGCAGGGVGTTGLSLVDGAASTGAGIAIGTASGTGASTGGAGVDTGAGRGRR